MISTHTTEQITPNMDGQTIRIAGRVYSKRVLGKLIFLKIRDPQGKAQVTIKKNREPEEAFETAENLTQESIVSIKGKVRKTDQTKQGYEVTPTEISVINEAGTPLPLELEKGIESELDTRLNQRSIDLRKPEKAAIFKVRNTMLKGIRKTMEKRGFTEIHTPKVVKEGAEGGATLFPVKYFKEEAYLAQSPQLFKQMMMATEFNRVYEVGEYFRAEKMNTSRHTSEFTGWDLEMAYINNQEEVMDVLEETIIEALHYTQKNSREDLEKLGVTLKKPKTPFKRITYEKAREIISEEGKKIPKGMDLGTEGEKVLGETMQREGHDLYFIKEYPSKEKPFYIMRNEEEPQYSYSFDLDYRGIEIASGGQREHRPKEVKKNMKQQGLNPSDFEYYLNSFEYGMPPHGGMGAGFDRIIQQLLELPNIREAILFPRDLKRLKP